MTVSLPDSVLLSCSVIKKGCNLTLQVFYSTSHPANGLWSCIQKKTHRFCNFFELLLLLEFLHNLYVQLIPYIWMATGHDIQPLYSDNTVQQALSPVDCFDAYSIHPCTEQPQITCSILATYLRLAIKGPKTQLQFDTGRRKKSLALPMPWPRRSAKNFYLGSPGAPKQLIVLYITTQPTASPWSLPDLAIRTGKEKGFCLLIPRSGTRG